ncbi:hypothetical protein [Adhaeribacter pallidiroseus]|uniref:Beta-xylosidase C-terminal Concanavalin A-like domain-containing protein n=1 Tax=Adhaeribacter pallidiroseus TaxID=2072847 RepID=A0A369QMF8_9BACT|nr:hypothetical protein [Adhaeribacter pallidiroseus]RDC64437.1 hypothetical protein AHMF7616_03051 [Adhaeribacter pallidiroseus]
MQEDSLKSRGWLVKTIDAAWWKQRNVKPGYLSLYTLTGDNWGNTQYPAGIKNLVIREIAAECFTSEVHLANFFPQQNWQQAGIILSEDASFTGKMLRLSISYNDYFGGYQNFPEIIIQAISSSESGSKTKPEEIAHLPLFTIQPNQEPLVRKNLLKSALKIEKKGNHYRFLYTTGEMENFAFKEAVSKDLDIQPKYIGLFAMQGLAKNSVIPAAFDAFNFISISCDN